MKSQKMSFKKRSSPYKILKKRKFSETTYEDNYTYDKTNSSYIDSESDSYFYNDSENTKYDDESVDYDADHDDDADDDDSEQDDNSKKLECYYKKNNSFILGELCSQDTLMCIFVMIVYCLFISCCIIYIFDKLYNL